MKELTYNESCFVVLSNDYLVELEVSFQRKGGDVLCLDYKAKRSSLMVFYITDN